MVTAAYRLPGVNLFASGVYRGKRWTPETVRAMQRNAGSLKNLHVPPAVLGHEENQELLKRTDLPNAGLVDPETVTVVPDPDHPGELILTGDVVNVPPEVADLILRGQYTHGSSEIYEDFYDDFERPRGPALRRFALLGGTPPQVKRLGRLPKPVPMAALRQFAEHPLPTQPAVALSFAEREMDPTPQTREELVKAVQAALPQLSQAFLDVLTDDQLKELVAAVPTPTPDPALATPPTGVVPMEETAVVTEMPADDAPVMSREEMIAALVAAGQDQTVLEAMPDEELKMLYDEVMAAAPPEEPAVAAMSEEERKKLPAEILRLAKYSELQYKRLRKQTAEVKRQKVTAFCDELVKAGKLIPAQRGDYLSLLLHLDDTHSVHKFADNGRTEVLTALDRKMRELARRAPVVRFGERLAGPGLAPQTAKADAVAKAQAHAETVPDGAWKATSFKTREGYVTKFAETYDKNPALAMSMLPATA